LTSEEWSIMAMMELTIKGRVRYNRGEIEHDPAKQCICCGERGVPHAHIHGEHVEFPDIESRHFSGLSNRSVGDYLHEFIHDNFETAEGKMLVVTFKFEE